MAAVAAPVPAPHPSASISNVPGQQASAHAPPVPAKLLYAAQVSRPMANVGGPRSHPPSRVGFRTVAWCEGHDLLAALSGCGSVSVFHADSPGETAMLVSPKKAHARHLAWQPSAPWRAAKSPAAVPAIPVLLVADASNRLTLWASRELRVNIWEPVASVELPAAVVAVGWIRSGEAVVAVLDDGNLMAWALLGPEQSGERRGPFALLPCTSGVPAVSLGGQVKCASIAPGGVDLHSVAVLAALAEDPTQIFVWHVSVSRNPDPSGSRRFETKPLGFAQLEPTDGNCIACLAAPKAGSLYGFGDTGAIGKWVYAKTGAWVRIKTENQPPESLLYSTKDRSSSQGQLARAALRRRRVTAAVVSFDGDLLAVADGDRSIALYTGRDLLPLGRISRDANKEPEAMPFWGMCLSPAACCIVGLRLDGLLQTWCLTAPQHSLGYEGYARKLVESTFRNGRRGGWDILAFLSRQGREATAAVAKAIPSLSGLEEPFRPTPEKTDFLRLSVLSAVDGDTASVASARRLLQAAVEAIRSTAPRTVLNNLVADPVQPNYHAHFSNYETVYKQMMAPVAIASGPNGVRPTPQEVAASPLADWIITLGVVWLRRMAAAIARLGIGQILGPEWKAITEQDEDEGTSDKMSVVKDPSLTKILRNSALCAATLLAAEVVAKRDSEHSEPRYMRLSHEDTADLVAAIWDTSRAGEAGQAPAMALALSKHPRAASALRSNPKLRIRPAERALGIRGSYASAGFILSSLRRDRAKGSDKPFSKAGEEEWCPFDIISGRLLPAWAPLRRCVVSGLLATEIPNRPTSGAPIPRQWHDEWVHESPFGGLWARVPSLDLERYELMNATTQPSPQSSPPPSQSELAPRVSAASNAPSVPVAVEQGKAATAGPQVYTGTAQLQNMTGEGSGLSRNVSALQGALQTGESGTTVAESGLASAGAYTTSNLPGRVPLAGAQSGGQLGPGNPQNLTTRAGLSMTARRGASMSNAPNFISAVASPAQSALSSAIRVPSNLSGMAGMSGATATVGSPTASNLMQPPPPPAQVGMTASASRLAKDSGLQGAVGSVSPPSAAAAGLYTTIPTTAVGATSGAGGASSSILAQQNTLSQVLSSSSEVVTTPRGTVRKRGQRKGSSSNLRRSPSGSKEPIASPSPSIAHQSLPASALDLPPALNPSVAAAGRQGDRDDNVSHATSVTNADDDKSQASTETSKRKSRTPSGRRQRRNTKNQQAAAAASTSQPNPPTKLDLAPTTERMVPGGYKGLENLQVVAGSASRTQTSNVNTAKAQGPGNSTGAATRHQTTTPPTAQVPEVQGHGPFGGAQLPGDNGQQPSGNAAPSGTPQTTAPTANRIWQGKLQVRGNKNDLVVPCVAISHAVRGRSTLQEAIGWPSTLTCDSSMLKESDVVRPYLNDTTAQWYVRFSPIDELTGQEIISTKLVELVKVMVDRKLAFQVECNADPENPGTLYLWGFNIQSVGYSLLGVYKPSSDDTQNLINDLLSNFNQQQ